MVIIKTTECFEAAHRQLGDQSKCGYLHGHNWVVEYVIGGVVNDPLGYLINFTDLKHTVDKYDHHVLLMNDDPLAAELDRLEQRVFRLPLNPTCENLAKLILEDVQLLTEITNNEVNFISVTVWENDVSMATDQWNKELVV